MKITNNLNKQVLTEAEEVQAVTISSDESAAEVLDKVETAAEDSGVVNTAEIASEITDAAATIGAEETTLDFNPEESLGAENKITQALSAALKAAERFKKKKLKEVANIMICGLPGSGKTASVYD